jgi:Probable N6-adenine methyltransferase
MFRVFLILSVGVCIMIANVELSGVGAIMADIAAEVLNVKQCRFRPGHANNLANEFRCFANYDTFVIDKE